MEIHQILQLISHIFKMLEAKTVNLTLKLPIDFCQRRQLIYKIKRS